MMRQYLTIICLILVSFGYNTLKAQSPMPVGIDSVVVVFNNPPSTVNVEKAALKYNKDFALSFQMDDALNDIYSIAYPLFEGNSQNGGMYYSNGCGDSVSFKMTSAIYIFSTYNGTDLLDPDDPYHDPILLTWNSINTLTQAGWGLANHGVYNTPQAGNDEVRDYEIQRTQSYARRNISDSTLLKSFIIPNNVTSYVPNVFGNNYHQVIDEETGADWLNSDGFGIDVEDNTINWLSPKKLNRFFDATHSLSGSADDLFQRSTLGSHRWIPWGMHAFPTSFISDFFYIYNTYGYSGLDNILISTDDDILDYLVVKQEAQVNTATNGDKATITFGGSIPSDRLHYDLSLNLFSDETISSINVYPTNIEHSYNGLSNDTALINLSWDGRYHYPMEYLADSFSSVANGTGSEWDALVAMDYIILMEPSTIKDSLRNVLCSLNQNGWQYGFDSGFCDQILVNLGIDDTLCEGACAQLDGDLTGTYTYEWSTGETTSSINLCPNTSDTTVWLTAYNSIGFSGHDTIHLNRRQCTFVDLGMDQSICLGDSVTFSGPDFMSSYEWRLGDSILPYTTQQITEFPATNASYNLTVTDTLAIIKSDTVSIFTFPTPSFTLAPDDTIQNGSDIWLVGPIGNYVYNWTDDQDSTYPSTDSINVQPNIPTVYTLEVTNTNGCSAQDSIRISINYLTVNLGLDTTFCQGSCDTLYGPLGMVSYKWYMVPDSVHFGDTISQKIEVCPESTTTYALHVIDTLGEKGVDTITYFVNPTPAFYLGPDTTIFISDSIELSGPDSSIYSYEWFVADTLYATTRTINVSPLDTTEYIHIVTDTSTTLNCAGADSIVVMVNFLYVNLGPDTTICLGQCVPLTGPGPDSIYTYEWYVADTIFDTTQYVDVCPLDSTIYSLVVYDTLGYFRIDSIVISVLPAPLFDLGEDLDICMGDSTLLEAPEPINDTTYSYLWSTGDTTRTIWVSPTDSVQYYVDVTNDSTLCLVSDSIVVITWDNPIISQIVGDTAACFGTTITLEVQGSGILSYLWSTGDTTQTTEVSPAVADSTYWYSIEVFNWLGCSAKDSTHVRLQSATLISMEDTIRICKGESVDVIANLSGTSPNYLIWTYGTTIDTTNSNVLTLQPAQSFTVYLEAPTAHCFSKDSTYLNVYPDATTEILYNNLYPCLNEDITLTASGASSYLWSTGDTTVEIQYTAIDTSTVKLIGTNLDGCVHADSVVVTPKPLPIVNIGGLLPAYCENDPLIDLIGDPPGGVFSGPGVIENQFSPNTSGPGTHEIVYSYEDMDLCTGHDTIRTTIYGNGNPIDLGPDVTVPLYSFITLDAGTGFDRIYWSTGDTTQTIDVYYTDRPPGTYTFTVVGVINGCTSQGSVEVSFLDPDGIPELSTRPLVVYPNPNDGKFTIVFEKPEKELLLTLHNMQGQVIYMEESINCGLDCKIEVSMPGLIPGMYYIRMTSDTHISSTKFIIKK